ncbi:unnamed protein product [Camellia sinensis]
MAVSSTWILSLKVLLISTGVVSIAMMLKFSVPLMIDFVLYEIPVIWSSLMAWLRPPYLYFVLNGIIVTIAASSRFLHKLDDRNESEPLVLSTPDPPLVSSPVVYESEAMVAEEKTVVMNGPDAVDEDEEDAFVISRNTWKHESEAMVAEEKTVVMNGPDAVDEDEEDAFVISGNTWKPPQRIKSPEIQTEYMFPSPEKPLVSARFGHRKPIKASPEGVRALRVVKPKRHETLENTWKMITDGRHMPLNRHLKKSDSWENHGRQFSTTTTPQDLSPMNVKKCETFRDRTNYDPPSSNTSSPGSGKIRKEPSLSQDELNRRVEAFIKKFNEEMRLQRQESLNQYKEMIKRGAH